MYPFEIASKINVHFWLEILDFIHHFYPNVALLKNVSLLSNNFVKRYDLYLFLDINALLYFNLYPFLTSFFFFFFGEKEKKRIHKIRYKIRL